MEFLPLLKDGPTNDIKIELLCIDEPYDGGEFLTYPDRRGWGDVVRSGLYNENLVLGDEFTRFLQGWLFLGLLESLIGLKSSEILQKDGDSTTQFLDTTLVPEVVVSWISDLESLADQAKQDAAGTIIAKLQEVARVLQACETSRARKGDPFVLYTIGLLGEYFCSALCDSDISQDMKDELLSLPWTHFKIKDNPVWQRMEENGHCLRNMVSLLTTESPIALVYAASLGSSEPHSDHRMCNIFKCTAQNVDVSNYRTAHAESGCDCDLVPANEGEAYEILKSGSIPLVTIVHDGRGATCVKLIPWSNELQYIAISHVWSDGLGNMESNSLPRCQLGRIAELCTTDQSMTPFWIDTLCCPRKPKEARDLAIAKMRDTYRNAEVVLVLDAWLYQKKLGQLASREVLMRTLCSSWMRRLWTYQEGALAQNIAVVFGDCMIDLEAEMKDFIQSRDPMDSCLKRTIVARYLTLRSKTADRPFSEPHDRFLATTLGLQFRATSIASDEAVCLANIMGLDVDAVLQVSRTSDQSTTERMKVFWRFFGEVTSIVLFTGGSRLTGAGFGWAPASFLNNADASSLTIKAESAPARQTPDGLLVKLPGFVLGGLKQPLRHTFVFADEQNHLYEVICMTVPSEDSMVRSDRRSLNEVSMGSINPWRDAAEFNPDFLGLILQTNLSPLNRFTTSVVSAILVSLKEKRNGVFHVKYECPASVRLMDEQGPDSAWSNIPDGLVTSSETGEGLFLFANKTHDQAEWCVD